MKRIRITEPIKQKRISKKKKDEKNNKGIPTLNTQKNKTKTQKIIRNIN